MESPSNQFQQGLSNQQVLLIVDLLHIPVFSFLLIFWSKQNKDRLS